MPPPPAFPPCVPGTVGCGGHWEYVPDGPLAPKEEAKPAAPTFRGPVYERATTWDANIDGAFGRYFGDSPAWTGFVRARAGVLFIREPFYNALGFTYEYSSLSKGTFGIQGEILHLDMGFWGQAGALLDVSGHPGGMVAFGLSIVGLEAQYREYDGRGSGVALYAKLRAPISIIARIFHDRSSQAPAAKQVP